MRNDLRAGDGDAADGQRPARRDRAGRIGGTLVLEVSGGRVQAIRAVVNPDKLRHLGAVADGWAVDREMRAARRRVGGQPGGPPR